MPTNVIVEASPTSQAQRNLIEAVRKANLPFPVRVTSTTRGTNDYHGQALAVDFAVGSSMTTDNSLKMRQLARVFIKYPGQLLELIHTTPFTDDNGFYVKNGSVVGEGYYGAATNAAHLNHVHVAASNAGSAAILNAISPAPSTPTTPTTPVPGGSMATAAEIWNHNIPKTATSGDPRTTAPAKEMLHGATNAAWQAVDEAKKILDRIKRLEDRVAVLEGKTPGTHTVVEGDTLSAIAAHYNTTVSELVRLNQLADPNDLSLGQVLKVR